ncbi:hypothetical protein KAR91_02355 [Candidatus Pacearchaeota archaeon]|nr:hypothetical protein [Candidatus Pacearchaeota archaeon]
MAIKNLNKRLVETMKIKIGGKGEERKKRNSNEKYRLPVKWDHFKVTTLEKNSTDNFIPEKGIMDLLGDKPKKLDILLLTDDIDKNFQTAYACYQGSKLFCMGDGETAERRFEEKGEIVRNPGPCNTETCEIFKSGACKPSGILSGMLPQAEKVGGVAKFRTHSWNSIINITSSLEAIKLITGGVLFGIPLTMELIEKQTEEHGKVKVVNIVYNGSMEKLQLEAGRQKQLRLSGSVSMTDQNSMLDQSGVLVDHDSPNDIQEEFYNQEPESENVTPKKTAQKKGTSPENVSENLKKDDEKKPDSSNKPKQENDLF